MRKHFSNYIEKIADQEDIVFITGDLGYNALENLRDKMSDRFINAGVAEQNMISVAAGIASQGFRVVCYSIAPFIVYRCLEQMRNDVCFHNLPVYIAGNGGGYHYGALGSSHHTLEDLATLSGLPNIRCYVPAFLDDMNTCMDEMFARRQPAYLRLGIGKEMPESLSQTSYGAAPVLNEKAKMTIVAQCPVVNNVIAALASNQEVDLFVVNRMPFTEMPAEMAASIRNTNQVLTVEEHVAVGGIGMAVATLAEKNAISVKRFECLCAQGYPDGLYGNQNFHQQASGLDTTNISNVIASFLE